MLIERGMGKGKEKRKEVAIPARVSKRARVDGASSSTSAPLGNGGGLYGSPEDVTSDMHSVLKKPPPPQASRQFIEAQGEPPTGGCKWNFNLEEESPGGTTGGGITLPPVPADWLILEALPSEEERATLPEAMFMAMVRCFEQHRMVG